MVLPGAVWSNMHPASQVVKENAVHEYSDAHVLVLLAAMTLLMQQKNDVLCVQTRSYHNPHQLL